MQLVFGSFLVTSCALTSCHVVISKQDSTIRAVWYNRCVTGRRPRDKNHAVRFRQRQKIGVERGTRSRSEVFQQARGCKRWHPLALGRRYGKRKSYLWVYVSPSISQLTTNYGALSRIKWERYFYKEVCFVRSLNCVNRGYTTCKY